MKIVVTSDLHYGLKSAGYDRTAEIDEVAKSIVDYAIEKKADVFIHGGDLGHIANPSSSIHGLWVRLFYRLSNAGIQSYFLLGNHDVTGTSQDRSGSLAPLRQLKLDKVQAVTAPEIVYDNGVTLLFLPYVRPVSNGVDENEEFVKKVRPLLEGKDSVVVAFTHLNVDGAVINDEHILRPVKSTIPKGLFNRTGLKLIASGHIHRPQMVETGTKVKHIVIGSPICTDFGDATKKSFVVIDVDGSDVKVSRVPSALAIPLVELSYNTTGSRMSARLVLDEKTRRMVTGAGVKVKVTCLEGQAEELGLKEFEGELATLARFVRPIVPTVLRQRDETFKTINGSMSDEEAVRAWVASRKPANEELVLFHAMKTVEDVG